MADADKSVCVIFNGEIYNFKELRLELEQLGYCFRTNCDTEVSFTAIESGGQTFSTTLTACSDWLSGT